jgi:hypothetical protein
MWTSHRLRSGLRRGALVLLIVVACSWVYLYLDSVHQRRKAERLISDLKSFPFATARFAEVRDLAERNGGTAIQQFPPKEFPQFGATFPDSQGHVHMPTLEGGSPTCTVRDCAFEIWILPQPSRLALRYRANMVLLMRVLAHSGIRPWGLYARFEVKGGKLEESRVGLGQLRDATLGRFRGLVSLEYDVVSTAHAVDGYPDYRVGAPHVTGPPTEILSTHFVQTSNAPTRRAFDVDLRCVTAVWRGCDGLRELAPSAWADHQSQQTKK